MGERFINEEQIGVSREEQLSFFIQSVEARKISRLILLAIYLKDRYPSVFYTFLFASENDYLTVTVRVAVQDGKWKIKGGTEGRILEYKCFNDKSRENKDSFRDWTNVHDISVILTWVT